MYCFRQANTPQNVLIYLVSKVYFFYHFNYYKNIIHILIYNFSLTWVLLALFKGLVDIDKGEVVSLWVLELQVALGRLWLQVHRGNHEASWC